MEIVREGKCLGRKVSFPHILEDSRIKELIKEVENSAGEPVKSNTPRLVTILFYVRAIGLTHVSENNKDTIIKSFLARMLWIAASIRSHSPKEQILGYRLGKIRGAGLPYLSSYELLKLCD